VTIRTYQGKTPSLGERVFVDASAVVIGDVEIGADSSVWPLVTVRGDMHRIRIGARTIEDEVILGAGSLVPPGKVLESGYLYVGSPVKKARPLTDKERAFFTYSAGNYVKLKDQHIAEGYAG
jgi:carbonic anhydrase/acetyltransferase-like protein (isoleucine patch superfamily)